MLAEVDIFELVAALVFLISTLIALVIFGNYFKLWFQAYMAGVNVPLVQIVGLTLQKIPAKRVVSAMIIGKMGGVVLGYEEIVAGYLRGADVERVATAMILASKEGKRKETDTFEKYVEMDLQLQDSAGWLDGR